MKLNWGWGIFLVYGFFALGLFYQVYKSTQYDHSLVVDDYYAEDIRYQDHYDRLANTQQLRQPPTMDFAATGDILLHFSAETPQPVGTVAFYRPDHSELDQVVAITTDSQGVMAVSNPGLIAGHWVVKISWDSQGRGYYLEQELDIRP